MHPVLFTIGSLQVHTYGVAMGSALFLGILLSVWMGTRDGIPASWMWDVGLILIGSSVIGSRLEYVRTHWSKFAGDPSKIVDLRDGGLVFYGGLIFSLLALAIYTRLRGLGLLRLLDHLAPSASLGHAIGRLGCFAAGCCFGKPTDSPWGVIFPPGGEAPAGIALHPTQLYESGFDLALGAYLLWRWERRRVPGEVVAAFLLYSATGRALIEQLRGDPQRGTTVFGLTNGEATSVVLGIIGLGLTLWTARQRRR